MHRSVIKEVIFFYLFLFEIVNMSGKTQTLRNPPQQSTTSLELIRSDYSRFLLATFIRELNVNCPMRKQDR